jgi:glucose-1-phosphate cytidylyltransferase
MRLYPTTEGTPKPLVPIGEKPMLWHLMKYYSYFGHNDFVLCLGYKGDQIKKYFLEYYALLSNDFVLSSDGKKRQLLKKDPDKWRITFVETGINSNIGQRLMAVKPLLQNEDLFLANYSDAVTDLDLQSEIDFFAKSGKIGCVLSVKPFNSYHTISTGANGSVKSIQPMSQSEIRINGGFFVFKNSIFDFMSYGEDLVEQPFQRLIDKQELVAYTYDGFWANMDTYKDKQCLDELASKGKGFWQVWEHKNYPDV